MSYPSLQAAIPCVLALVGAVILLNGDSAAAGRKERRTTAHADVSATAATPPDTRAAPSAGDARHRRASTVKTADQATGPSIRVADQQKPDADRGGSSDVRVFSGVASFYHEPQALAGGGTYDPHGMTAAHRTLPLGTQVRVSDPRTGRSVVVTINDRGPFVRARVLDLSLTAARALGMTSRGVMFVNASVL